MFKKLTDWIFNRIALKMLKSTRFLEHRHEAGDHTHQEYMDIALQNQREIAQLRKDLRTHLIRDIHAWKEQ